MKFLGNNVKPDDVMLLNMVYSYGSKDTDFTDSLEIIYRDLQTNEKKLKVIKKPEIEIYFTKPEYRDYDYSKAYIEIDKTDKHLCPVKNVPWYIAKQAGDQYVTALKEMVASGDRRGINKMHKYPYVFGSDMDAESFYRVHWLLEYDNDKPKQLTKAFFDIEVDTIMIPGFPQDGECPVNIITLVNEENRSVYTLMLNNPGNPLIVEFMNEIDSFVDELHEMFDEVYGVFEYNLYMYDDEAELIASFYKIINSLKPDFLLGWNSFGFDEPYLIARMKNLNLDPYEIMTHPDFFNKVCKFVKDDRNFDIKNKSDRFELSSYTKHIDHMRLYAATRKGRSELRSFNLNYVGRMEVGDEKIDYSEEANIKTLPYVNYKLFVIYNIKDVLLEYAIEKKANDIDNLYFRSYSNCSPYDKVFKQTFMLKRRAYYEYLLEGNILANNINVFNNEESSFSGALVANPLLNSNAGVELFGYPSMYVFDNVIDMDFSAMYPHIIVAFNIERNTMIGKLIIPGFEDEVYDHIYINEEIYDNSSSEESDDDDDELVDEPECLKAYDAGRDFVEGYLTGDIHTMGSRWFNLPTYNKLHDDFKKEFHIKKRKRLNISKAIRKIASIFNIDIDA